MKKELRKKFIKERNTLPEEYRIEASNKIFSLLEELDLFNKAERIFVFVGFGSEITTEIFTQLGLRKESVFTRIITSKKMPLRVSNIDKKGAVESMNKETVLIFRKE